MQQSYRAVALRTALRESTKARREGWMSPKETAETDLPVQVLLATYNGERFLREQIDSILAQTYRPLTILARDDGSKDGTPAILAEYAARNPERFAILADGTPSGSAKANFIRLIDASTAPFIACADQDDVWLPAKIEKSVQAMRRLQARHGAEAALLVFTDLAVVDEDLRVVDPSMWSYQGLDPEKVHTIARLLPTNVVTGCTMLLNRPMARLATPMPPRAYMHDWWIALLACCFGSAEYVAESLVLYRQHGSNVLGAMPKGSVTGIPKWRQHDKRRESWELVESQAEALLQTHGHHLDGATRKLLNVYKVCEHSPSRWVRTCTFLRHGFMFDTLRMNLAIAWYLWDMKFAKQQDRPPS